MALTNAYVQVYGQLPEIFQRISEAAAPDKFTNQHLKDWGYTSSNFRAVIPILKALGFLSAEGTPTSRYHDYRGAHPRQVMAEAIKEAYGDLFTIKAKPTTADRDLIEGKFKSAHNASPNTAKLMAATFFALLDLADLNSKPPAQPEIKVAPQEAPPPKEAAEALTKAHSRPSLHYNIQIHLPATKDIEVFNAIFKSLKEHLLD
ncbi:DUF5343 domain-containing protein [Vogesella sp. LIG4]|uniref:DUF5343 domain-containing protein n=1 Tax=Vogesella sp. LIG4 TaxID=1192162 RepID=UPI00081F99FD|nr:DUF5343 domain-containing protein [Vogesella sp. LIG4]SCK22629.1 hypothetical protein PSELUDRAFT_2617 [Vogesella sp. LIG4]